MKAYFRRIGKAENDTCFGRCKHRQNTKHLILECRRYSEERLLIVAALEEARLPLTLPILFNTKVGKGTLAEFLTTTSICIAE